MSEKTEIIWSDKFVSGNKELDAYHKEIIDGVVELYKMLDDTNKYKKEIPELTQKIEDAMYVHMDIEINYLKQFNLEEEWKIHELNHDRYKRMFIEFKRYNAPQTIKAVLIGESIRDYMREHFFHFDYKDIQKINKKLKELQ